MVGAVHVYAWEELANAAQNHADTYAQVDNATVTMRQLLAIYIGCASHTICRQSPLWLHDRSMTDIPNLAST